MDYSEDTSSSTGGDLGFHSRIGAEPVRSGAEEDRAGNEAGQSRPSRFP